MTTGTKFIIMTPNEVNALYDFMNKSDGNVAIYYRDGYIGTVYKIGKQSELVSSKGSLDALFDKSIDITDYGSM